ncbi:hypothetical protein BDW02DRAFT_369921 [Decorospora gaudefroyi]|uniref:DUF7730 domain-containing protein n=1 Tax=Decorospora gaudefroyi TaxID=184978 RepID=A0A6A5K8T5_9PLEO|nr:hypothetical protein BDW02DRAFT_369921 [Decorospora gaudefroyi]
MAKLGAWVKEHLGLKPCPRKQSTDQPPFLPSVRRPITPTSFDTPTCLFFRLPYDIRSMIFSIAFGGRAFHVDIVHQERAWQWRGYVCLRNGPRLPSMRYAWLGPWLDACLQDREWCERTGNTPGLEAYRVGAMGFLLSCRQAYTEGIDVLYSANCISIQSEPLLLHLPQLIPLNRLASITSLEMVIRAHHTDRDDGKPSLNLDHMKPILDNVTTHCHHLRSFCLSFVAHTKRSYRHELLDSPALPWNDAFCRSMNLRNMRVELPAMDYWRASRGQVQPMEYHPSEAPAKGPFGRSLWRCLDSEEPSVQFRAIERYPYPPLKLAVLEDGDESVESAGYWLAEGESGPEQQYVTCF